LRCDGALLSVTLRLRAGQDVDLADLRGEITQAGWVFCRPKDDFVTARQRLIELCDAGGERCRGPGQPCPLTGRAAQR
jgi:hypothetical protein